MDIKTSPKSYIYSFNHQPMNILYYSLKPTQPIPKENHLNSHEIPKLKTNHTLKSLNYGLKEYQGLVDNLGVLSLVLGVKEEVREIE